jgi:hypothetical protein
MKADLRISVPSSDIKECIKEVVEEIAERNILSEVKSVTKKQTEEKLKELLEPTIIERINKVLVGREYPSRYGNGFYKDEVEKVVGVAIKRYLDESVYHYSKTSNELSRKYMPSSSGGSDKTRAEWWILNMIEKNMEEVVFEYLDKKINKMITEMVPSKEEIENAIKKEIESKLKAITL